MGMLIEKLEGRRAGTFRRARMWWGGYIHVLEIVHGDPNRHNFVVDEQNGIVRLIDFENARDYSDVKSKEEIESLKD